MPSKYWRRQVRKVTCTSRRERDYLPSRPLRSSALPPAPLCVHPLSLPCNTYIPPGDFVTYVNCFVVASGIKSSKQQTTFQISTESTLPSIPIGIIGTMNPKLRDPWKPVIQSPCREPWAGAWDDSAFCVEELTKKAAWCISGPGPHGSHRRWCWQRTNIETLRSIWIFSKGFNELLNPFLINLNKSTWMRCW